MPNKQASALRSHKEGLGPSLRQVALARQMAQSAREFADWRRRREREIATLRRAGVRQQAQVPWSQTDVSEIFIRMQAHSSCLAALMPVLMHM